MLGVNLGLLLYGEASVMIRTGDTDPIKQPPRRVPLAHADKERGYQRTQSQRDD